MKYSDISRLKYPYKFSMTVSSLILSGSLKININLVEYQITAPSLVIIQSGHILQIEECSEDFSADNIICSERYMNNLSGFFTGLFPLYMDVYNNPVFPLNNEDLTPFVEHYSKVRQTLSDTDNPYRLEILMHQNMLFFYMTSYHYHQTPDKPHKTNQEILVDSFLNLVRTNYLEQRMLDFYADKLCLTPKYLTTVVKRTSGTSATEWIEKFVMLEAQTLLKSTNFTIQQISDKLNFSSQTFFGKYFKRLAGVSPSEYRKK